MRWQSISQRFTKQWEELMILFWNNFLQWSFLQIFCLDGLINIIERRFKDRKFPLFYCSEEGGSI